MWTYLSCRIAHVTFLFTRYGLDLVYVSGLSDKYQFTMGDVFSPMWLPSAKAIGVNGFCMFYCKCTSFRLSIAFEILLAIDLESLRIKLKNTTVLFANGTAPANEPPHSWKLSRRLRMSSWANLLWIPCLFCPNFYFTWTSDFLFKKRSQLVFCPSNFWLRSVRQY